MQGNFSCVRQSPDEFVFPGGMTSSNICGSSNFDEDFSYFAKVLHETEIGSRKSENPENKEVRGLRKARTRGSFRHFIRCVSNVQLFLVQGLRGIISTSLNGCGGREFRMRRRPERHWVKD